MGDRCGSEYTELFYERWLAVEDSRTEEMESAIDEITKAEFGTKQKLVC